jgi:hypothetical protein
MTLIIVSITWGVALLCSIEAMVRVVGAQSTGSWGMWCRFVVGVVVGGRIGCVVVGVEAGEGFGYAVAEVVASEGFDPTELLVFAPDDGERRGCIVARRALLAVFSRWIPIPTEASQFSSGLYPAPPPPMLLLHLPHLLHPSHRFGPDRALCLLAPSVLAKVLAWVTDAGAPPLIWVELATSLFWLGPVAVVDMQAG